jgi:hypothetical protein
VAVGVGVPTQVGMIWPRISPAGNITEWTFQ